MTNSWTLLEERGKRHRAQKISDIKIAYVLAMLPRRRSGLLRVEHHLGRKQLSPVVLVGSELLKDGDAY